MQAPAATKALSRLPRHRFAAEVREKIWTLHSLDNLHGPAAWASDVAWIAAAIALAQLARGTVVFWPSYILVALPVIATRQRALATLLHESAHGVIAKSEWLNDLLGTYLSGYLIFQTRAAYFASHVRDHHGKFGDPDDDPDLIGHLQAGLYDPLPRWRFVLKFLVLPLFLCQGPEIVRLVRDRLLYNGVDLGDADQHEKDRREKARLLAYVVSLSLVVGFVFGPLQLALYWYIPLLVGFPVVSWYLELLEHFPLPLDAEWDIEATRHRAVGRISRHFLGIHNEGYHLDHHLTPKIPFWNLPQAHQIRMSDPAYRAVVEATGAAQTGNVLGQFRLIIQGRPGGRSTERSDAIVAARPT